MALRAEVPETATRVYPGYPLGPGRWVGITEDHRWVMGSDQEITPVGGWGVHPLATPSGIEMLVTLVSVDVEWRSLTKAQQRCLLDPGSATARPWAALAGRGLVTDGALTARGMFLRLAHEWTVRASERAA